MKEIKPEELQKNPFQMIGKEWLLVTAEKEGKTNTLTASWGALAYVGQARLLTYLSARSVIRRNSLTLEIISHYLCWERITERL